MIRPVTSNNPPGIAATSMIGAPAAATTAAPTMTAPPSKASPPNAQRTGPVPWARHPRASNSASTTRPIERVFDATFVSAAWSTTPSTACSASRPHTARGTSPRALLSSRSRTRIVGFPCFFPSGSKATASSAASASTVADVALAWLLRCTSAVATAGSVRWSGRCVVGDSGGRLGRGRRRYSENAATAATSTTASPVQGNQVDPGPSANRSSAVTGGPFTMDDCSRSSPAFRLPATSPSFSGGISASSTMASCSSDGTLPSSNRDPTKMPARASSVVPGSRLTRIAPATSWSTPVAATQACWSASTWSRVSSGSASSSRT
ncbi:hypothetical protein RhoFasK5_02590|nr:hypothetical protein [Rhodococcus kroppenstedtii]